MKNRKRIEAFWDWFGDNHKRFRKMDESNRDELLDEIMQELHVIDENLFFEVSLPQDGICDFVITAEGRRNLFALVDDVIDAAPPLKGWTFTALRPALGFEFAIDFESLHLDPKELWFAPLTGGKNDEQFGMQIGIPKLKKRDEQAALNASTIILDTGLGERRSTEEIDHVEVVPLPSDPDAEGFIQLTELPEYLDWRKSKRRTRRS